MGVREVAESNKVLVCLVVRLVTVGIVEVSDGDIGREEESAKVEGVKEFVCVGVMRRGYLEVGGVTDKEAKTLEGSRVGPTERMSCCVLELLEYSNMSITAYQFTFHFN